MGLLDRYGVNGEEQPREENVLLKEAAKYLTINLQKWQLKTRLQKQKREYITQLSNSRLLRVKLLPTKSMRKLIDEYVEKPEYNIPHIDRDTIKEQLYDDIMATAQSNALLTAMSILKLW